MKAAALRLVPTLALLISSLCHGSVDPIVMDSETMSRVDRIIARDVVPAAGQEHGDIVDRVSAAFLNTPYRANTLQTASAGPERLTVNFNGVDCFTFIDYVEALSRSQSRAAFLTNLADTRYVQGHISYASRRHFFTDWSATSPRNAVDITADLSPAAVTVSKQLNATPDGKRRLAGVAPVQRWIHYIPAAAISTSVLARLRTGDYLGVYSPHADLDVSHVGIVIRRDGRLWFRNASSLAAKRRVVDTPFDQAMRSWPGIIVLRAPSGAASAAFPPGTKGAVPVARGN